MKSVLIVDEEPSIQTLLRRGLASRFEMIETTGEVAIALAMLERCHFDLIIADIRVPDDGALEWVSRVRAKGNQTPIIFITAQAKLETVIAALRLGALDFLLKPLKLEPLLASIDHCLERQPLKQDSYVQEPKLAQPLPLGGIRGECAALQRVCQIIRQVAPMPSTVLLEGESGTGKELAARAIHELSGRHGHFVSLNCGATSPELLESELFGHVKGAFTGAYQAREGLFAYANGGTLFLDEIGDMPLAMQVHLLRVLEEQRIRPVGSNREVPIEVRIIAATNRELQQEVKQGRFRQDLFYRLNVLSIRLPPLRERGRDTELLAQHFMSHLARELGVMPLSLSSSEVLYLQNYAWPGNVRELKNVIERALLLGIPPSQCLIGTPQYTPKLEEDNTTLLLEEVEKRHILRVLETEEGNKSAAAKVLGVSRKTLERKLQAWALK
ncbi:sigma-54-dependent transcriptional regulator [Thiofilum flexile]|uniref:sigma-54-dependent transcriptional regulator n=1 Tax=Thiofilum flexile TaxID=125627 RepID=UPI00036F89F8|nr:sigma-54 dependent transcriptional regulator [Thiofilum flexile]